MDLFQDEINDAQKYYSIDKTSAFNIIIQEMLKEIGILNIKCITLPISSWQKDFVWNNEIKCTALGGTEVENSLSLNFISKIAELSS